MFKYLVLKTLPYVQNNVEGFGIHYESFKSVRGFLFDGSIFSSVGFRILPLGNTDWKVVTKIYKGCNYGSFYYNTKSCKHCKL